MSVDLVNLEAQILILHTVCVCLSVCMCVCVCAWVDNLCVPMHVHDYIYLLELENVDRQTDPYKLYAHTCTCV
jgi:hypothetical protein